MLGIQNQNLKGILKFFLILFILFCTSQALAGQQTMSLHGRVTSSGSSLSSGDLQVWIYDNPTAGNLVYNSGADFNGTIINGVVDVLLGSGSTKLDLNYGTFYYMDLNVNGTELDFNGNERMQFESSRGNDANLSVVKVSSSHLLFRNTAGTSEFARVTSDGNLGIANSAPKGKLNVIGDVNILSGAAVLPSLYINPTDGNISVALSGVTAGFRIDINGNVRMIGDLNLSRKITLTDLNLLGVATLGAGTIVLTADGNVGINNTTPKNKFSVIGDLNITTSATALPSLFISQADGNLAIAASSVTTGFRVDINGDARVNRDVNVGRRLNVTDVNRSGIMYVREAPVSDACMGTAALIDGNVTVTSTCTLATSRVFITRYGGAFSEGFDVAYVVGTVRSGSFDINSTLGTDANTVAWVIFNPA